MKVYFRLIALALKLALGASPCLAQESEPTDHAYREGLAIHSLEAIGLGDEQLGGDYAPLLAELIGDPEFAGVVRNVLKNAGGDRDDAYEALEKNHADIWATQRFCLQYASFLLKPVGNPAQVSRPNAVNALVILSTLLTRGNDVQTDPSSHPYFRGGYDEGESRFLEPDEAKILDTVRARLAKLLLSAPFTILPPMADGFYILEWFNPEVLVSEIQQTPQVAESLKRWVAFGESGNHASEQYLYLIAHYLSTMPQEWDNQRLFAFYLTHHAWNPEAAKTLFASRMTSAWITRFLEGVRGASSEDFLRVEGQLFPLMGPENRVAYALDYTTPEPVVLGLIRHLRERDELARAPNERETLRAWTVQRLIEYFETEASQSIRPRDLYAAYVQVAAMEKSENPVLFKILESRTIEAIRDARDLPLDRLIDDVGTTLAGFLHDKSRRFNVVDYLKSFAIPNLLKSIATPISEDYAEFVNSFGEVFFEPEQENPRLDLIAIEFRELMAGTTMIAPYDSYFTAKVMLFLLGKFGRSPFPVASAVINRLTTASTMTAILSSDMIKLLPASERQSHRALESFVLMDLYRDEVLRKQLVQDFERAASSSANLLPYLPNSILPRLIERIDLRRLFDHDESRVQSFLLNLIMHSFIPFDGTEIRDRERLLRACDHLRRQASLAFSVRGFSSVPEKQRQEFWQFMISPPAYYARNRPASTTPYSSVIQDLYTMKQLHQLDYDLAPLYRKFFEQVPGTSHQTRYFFESLFVRARGMREVDLPTPYFSIYRMANRMKLDPELHLWLWQQAEQDQMLGAVLACCGNFIRSTLKKGIATITIKDYLKWQDFTLRKYKLSTQQAYDSEEGREFLSPLLHLREPFSGGYVNLYQTLEVLLDRTSAKSDVLSIGQAIKDIDQNLASVPDHSKFIWSKGIQKARDHLISSWSRKYYQINKRTPLPGQFFDCNQALQ